MQHPLLVLHGIGHFYTYPIAISGKHFHFLQPLARPGNSHFHGRFLSISQSNFHSVTWHMGRDDFAFLCGMNRE